MKTIFKILSLLLVSNTFAQWTYNPDQPNILAGGTDSQYTFTDSGPHSVIDNAGNTITIFRNTTIPEKASGSIYAQKTDANGNQLWGPEGKEIYSGTFIWGGGVNYVGNGYAQIVSDGNGGAFIAFQGYDYNFSGNSLLFVVRINADGNLVWPGTGRIFANRSALNVTSSFEPVGECRIIADGDGGVYVAWNSYVYTFVNQPVGVKVFMQHIYSDGSYQWVNELLIKTLEIQLSQGWGDFPVLMKLNTNEIIIGWLDYIGNDANNVGLFVNKIDVNGNLKWGIDGVLVEGNIGSSRLENLHPKFSNSTNGVFITYRANDKLKINYINYNGVLTFGSGLTLSSSYSNSDLLSNPFDMTSDALGNALVLYKYSLPETTGALMPRIQRIDQNGNLLFGATGISPEGSICNLGSEYLFGLKINNTSDGNHLAVWTKGATSSSIPNTSCQKITDTGQLLFPSLGVILYNGGVPGNVNLLADKNGGGLITFSGYNGGNDGDVLAAKIKSTYQHQQPIIELFNADNSTVMNTNDGINYTLNDVNLTASMTSFIMNTDYMYYGFTDFPSGNVFCSPGANISGTVPAGTYTVSFNINTGAYTFQSNLGVKQQLFNEVSIFPNPTRTTLNIKVPKGIAITKISIADLTGKVVKNQFVTENQSSEANTIQIDVDNLARGMYIVETFSGEDKFIRKFIKE